MASFYRRPWGQTLVITGHSCLWMSEFPVPRLRPGSLTHWKKCYPSLFSSVKITPFFVAKRPLFCNKALTFQSKMNPLFCSKTLTCQPKCPPPPPFHGKILDIKNNPIFSKFVEVSTKILPFSRKMRILDFLKKYPFIHEF